MIAQRPVLLVVGPVPPPPHGTSMYVRLLLDSPVLAQRWRVAHLDTSDRRSLENLGRFEPMNVLLGLQHAGQLLVRLVRDRPRVVWIPLSQNAPAYLRDLLFITLAWATGARVVGHLHGGWFDQFYRTAAPPVRWAIRAGCAMLSSAWVLGEGLRPCFAGLVPSARVRVVANGVPDPQAVRRRDPARPFTVLYLGQLSDLKGVDDLVEAFGSLGVADARLVLAGDWLTRRDEQRIRHVIGSSAARDRIELVGPVGAACKARWLGESDVLVLPARSHEGQPLVIMEAMAAGLPVIATRRGAIADMVEHEGSGLLVPGADPDALCVALERLAADPTLRERLGREGQRRWAAGFTAEDAMVRVVDALEPFSGRAAEAAPATAVGAGRGGAR